LARVARELGGSGGDVDMWTCVDVLTELESVKELFSVLYIIER
jgi:hypothetical protein